MNTNPTPTVTARKKTTTQATSLLLNKVSLVILAILLVMAAWAGQTIIVVLLGLALAAAGLSKFWSYLSLKGVHAERYLSEQRVFPDEHIELKLRVVNRKLLPLPWVQVKDEVPMGFVADLKPLPGSMPGFGLITESSSILWYSAINWKYRLTCNKRGYYPLGPLTVTSGDIFGFYPRTNTEPVKDFIIVYPRVYTLNHLIIPSLYPLGEAKSTKRIFEDPSRTIGVRDYSPGDSLRRIHWKASARHQQLQVKVFEPTTTLKAAIFLSADSFQSEGIWQEDKFELGISTAASLTNYLIDRKSQVGLWTNSKLADSKQPGRIPPGGGVGQLVQILEVLAKIIYASSDPFTGFFQSERKVLPMGTTLIFIFAHLPDKLKDILADLKESGYKVLVFQIGEGQSEVPLPEIPWYYIRNAGNLAEVQAGEN